MKTSTTEIPKGEIVWQRLFDSQGNLRYIITSKALRDYYYLYEIIDGKPKKAGRDKTPPALLKNI